jgi:hypothetical protein
MWVAVFAAVARREQLVSEQLQQVVMPAGESSWQRQQVKQAWVAMQAAAIWVKQPVQGAVRHVKMLQGGRLYANTGSNSQLARLRWLLQAALRPLPTASPQSHSIQPA